MKIVTMLAVLIFLSVSIGTALADCLYNGLWYPTGTNINGVICQPDGTWR